MYMYRYEKHIKYYGHIDETTKSNKNELIETIRAFGPGLEQAQVGVQTLFTIDARGVLDTNENVKVIVTTPSNSPCPIEIVNSFNGLWTISYIPYEIGDTFIDIFFGNQIVPGCPFRVNIFDINQIHISNIDASIVGQLVQFNIDASRAGIGQLEIIVQDGRIPSHAISDGRFHFNVVFLPNQSGKYLIDIKFNGIPIPNSPFSCYVLDLSRITVSDSLTTAHIGLPLSFDIHHEDFDDYDNECHPLDVLITTPSGCFLPYKRTQFNETTTRIDYVLNEIGTHRVDIGLDQGKMDINGSPFSLKAYDANRLTVSEIPKLITYNQPVEFTVDAATAGEGQLEVAINDGLVANQVKALGNSKFLFTFLPKTTDPHIVSIKFNGQSLPGFPKECQIYSPDDITTRGPGLSQALLGAQTWFTIDTPSGGSSDVQVTVFTPANEQLKPSTLLTKDGLRVDWTPDEVGTYTVHVSFAGNSVPGSPFRVKCYDPKKVIVTPPTSDGAVRKATRFTVDASRAGEGNLEISINHSGKNIPNQVTSIGNSRFEVQFTPQEATVHYCNILFNGEPVSGSPFTVNVMDTQRVVVFGKGLGTVPVNIPTSFTILTQNAGVGELKCSIKDPDDQFLTLIMTKIDPNRYEVTYTPDRIGEYHIEILQDGIPIDDNLYACRVFDINQVIISDFPSTSIIDSATSFLVDATNSGSGNLEISISINEKNIPNYVQNEGGARFRVKFIPNQIGIYSVRIKFNGLNLSGSPYLCTVYSSEFTFENYEYASINKRTSFLIKPKSNELFNRNLHVDVRTPSGKSIDSKIEEKTANIYVLRFLPDEIGDHKIIFYRDKDKKSVLTKFTSHIYDATKIRISDLPPAVGQQVYRFTVNTIDAGKGSLVVKIKQNDVRLAHEQIEIVPQVYEISFLPQQATECSVQIIFNGENNFGTLTIPMINDIKPIHVSSIPTGIVGQNVQFTVSTIDSKSVSVVITETHTERIVSHVLSPISNETNHYLVSFTPTIARQHTILICYDNQPISVYNIDVFDLKKIRVSSINDGVVGKPVVFTVDTHGAGEGHLEVTISDGRQTLPAELKHVQARKFDIGFLPESAGKYSISIAFNSVPVDGSPFEIDIHELSNSGEEDNDDDNEEEDDEEDEDENDNHEFLIGGQLEGTKVGELAWLICDTALSEIYEDFDLFITDPDQNVIKHTRTQDSAGRWRIEFEPMKTGIYQIQTNDNENNEQSTMILASMDILAENFERTLEGERIIHPNIPNTIVIYSKNKNYQIRLRRSNGDEIPIEIDKEDPIEWKIYFTLNQTDYYQFSLTDENNDEQIYDIHCLAEEVDIFRNGGIEDITRLIVDRNKFQGSDVNVIVKDPFAHTIPAAFYRNSDRDLVIEYVPTKTDFHEVFIRTDNNLLDICPIRINSFDADHSFEPVLRIQVKEVLEHVFEGIIDDKEKLQIEIIDPFERLLPFQRLTNEHGELKIALSPVRVGTHWIRVSNNESQNFALLPIFAFDDDYVPLSPVLSPSIDHKSNNDKETNNSEKDFLNLSDISENLTSQPSTLSSPSAQKINRQIDQRQSPEVHVLDITDLSDPGVRIVSKFSFKDLNDIFQIKIYDAEKNMINYKTEYLLDGRKRIFYEPTVIGPVEIHIFKNNEPIDESPLIVHAFDPAAVHLIDLPESFSAQTIHRFTIDPTNAGKGSLKVSIRDPNNRSLPINVVKRPNGYVVIEFEPKQSGPHIISVLFNRIAIPETPLRIHVEQERTQSLIAQARLSKSNENLIEPIDLPRVERITKSEDRNLLSTNLSQEQLQKYQMIKEKFDKHLPIDTVIDPRRYPFKILSKHPYPIVNQDVHLLIDLPQVAYVQISINGIEVPLHAARRNDDTFLLKFHPTIAGQYSIILKDFVEQTFPGCPYLFPVYNPNAVHVEPFNRLQPITDCHFICNVDKAGPGKIFIMIYCQNQSKEFQPISIPIEIQSRPGNHICISFTPPTIGIYRLYLAYRNLPVNGTPIDVIVYDIRRISIIPEYNQPAVVRAPITYRVHTDQAGQGQLKVDVVQPLTVVNPCRYQIQEINSQEYRIQYVPNEPGRYQLRILFNNQLVQGKTFDTDVFQSLSHISSIRIYQVQPQHPAELGDEICLQIFAENPPLSSIQSQILSNGTSVPYRIERAKDLPSIWFIKFRPYTSGLHQISLISNGISLLSSPYQIQVKDSPTERVLLEGLEQIQYTNSPCVIQVHAENASTAQIRVVVLLGSRQIPSTTAIINNNLIRIQFIPQEPGLYAVHVSCLNLPIEGSPFSIRVERPQAIRISGECFHRLRLHDLGIFRIHCHRQRGSVQAKIYNLSIGDRSDLGQIISFQLNDSHEKLLHFPLQLLSNSLTYLLATQLKVAQDRIRNLTLGKEHGRSIVSFQLHEAPYQTPANDQIIHHLRHLINHQTLNLLDPNRCVLKAHVGSVIVGPKGEPVSVKLFPQASGDYTGEFTPTKIGQHRIDITFASLPVQGSPFFTEVYDPSQVRIGPLPKDFIVGTEHTFEIHLDNAGNVPLEIKISSPSGANVPLKVDDASPKSTSKKVRFTPNDIGVYYLNAKFGSEPVPGTPIKMIVNDVRLVTACGDGIHHALHEKPATFYIDTQEMQGDLKVRIEGPNSVIKNTLERANDDRFKVTYVPVEVGFVNISIKWNGKDIANSPFKAAVTNPERVRIVGGWQSILDSEDRMHLIINEEKKVRFDTSHAGPGTLKADIRGTADGLRVPLRLDQQGAFSTLSFTATREGKYDITITYDGNPLPNMPIRGIAASPNVIPNEHLKVEVHGRGSYEAKVNEEAEFTIDTSKTSAHGAGMPVVRLTGVQADVEVRIRQIEANIFLCSYIPTAPGAYLLSVTWAERQINGSPFKINVLPTVHHDHSASRVVCSGEGLRTGILGKEIKCLIDARAAGPGELTAYCQGTNKTAFCRLFDHRDGTFTLFVKPQEGGKHNLIIKYNNEDVPGSPYTLKVNGAPDASKVKVSGPGIEHGVLSTFQSHFVCETKGAGAGQLTVKIRGPKGAFRVEMQREHLQDRTIICRYNPTEPGDYLISVKWSDEHVYGSPFHTHIFERQEDLDRFLHEQNTFRHAQHQWRDEI